MNVRVTGTLMPGQAHKLHSLSPPPLGAHREPCHSLFLMKKSFTLLSVYSTWAPHYHVYHFLQHPRLSRCHSHVDIEFKSCIQKQINVLYILSNSVFCFFFFPESTYTLCILYVYVIIIILLILRITSGISPYSPYSQLNKNV